MHLFSYPLNIISTASALTFTFNHGKIRHKAIKQHTH